MFSLLRGFVFKIHLTLNLNEVKVKWKLVFSIATRDEKFKPKAKPIILYDVYNTGSVSI